MRNELQAHVVAHNPLEHGSKTGDGFGQIQSPRLHDLAPAEGEQLASEVGRPLGGADDFAGCNGRRDPASVFPAAAMNRNRV